MEPFSISSIGYTLQSSDLDLPILKQNLEVPTYSKAFYIHISKRVSTVFLGLLFWTIKEPMHAVGVHSIVVACESPKDVPIKSIFLRFLRKKNVTHQCPIQLVPCSFTNQCVWELQFAWVVLLPNAMLGAYSCPVLSPL